MSFRIELNAVVIGLINQTATNIKDGIKILRYAQNDSVAVRFIAPGLIN